MLILLTPDEIRKYGPYLMSALAKGVPIPVKELPSEMQQAIGRLDEGSEVDVKHPLKHAEACEYWACRLVGSEGYGNFEITTRRGKDITLYMAGPGVLYHAQWLVIGGPFDPQDLAPLEEAIGRMVKGSTNIRANDKAKAAGGKAGAAC